MRAVAKKKGNSRLTRLPVDDSVRAVGEVDGLYQTKHRAPRDFSISFHGAGSHRGYGGSVCKGVPEVAPFVNTCIR